MKAFKYANILIPNRAGHKMSLMHFLDRGFIRVLVDGQHSIFYSIASGN